MKALSRIIIIIKGRVFFANARPQKHTPYQVLENIKNQIARGKCHDRTNLHRPKP